MVQSDLAQMAETQPSQGGLTEALRSGA